MKEHKSTHERFWDKVNQGENGCWVRAAYIDNKGYGTFRDGKMTLAHRYAYIELRGPIPGDLELDHLCRNSRCVNPAHLEPVTHRMNILRGIGMCAINAKKTSCSYGHSFTPENTGIDNLA